MANPLRMEAPRGLYGDCAKTAQRIIRSWSRRQTRQSVKAALLARYCVLVIMSCHLANDGGAIRSFQLSQSREGQKSDIVGYWGILQLKRILEQSCFPLP